MAAVLADPNTPGSLANAIGMLAHGLEKYSDFSGIRFDDEAFKLLEECLAEHFEPYRNIWSKGRFATHTASCDLSEACVKVLCELSDDLDNGESCVTRGVESRIAKHHLDKFVEIVGREIKPNNLMTSEEKQLQIEKFERFKAYVFENRHRIFPRDNRAYCHKHHRMCKIWHRERHFEGFNANRLRIATGSPECVAWTPIGKNLGFADDSEFSSILHMAQRKVEAENETEDMFFEECGPNSKPSKHDELSSTHRVVSVKFGTQHIGTPLGRER